MSELATKTFDLQRPLDLPRPLSWHRLAGRYLCLAPEVPNWLVTDRAGAALLTALGWGEKPHAALRFAAQTTGVGSTALETTLRTLLAEIERRRFYAGAPRSINDDPTTARRVLHAYLTTRCNLSCPQCYMDSGPQRSGELSTQAWLQILEQFTQIHDESQVIFSGGEPLLRPDFLHIARRAQSLEHHLTLLTNGTLIQDRERARALAAACDWIQISLDGATAEVHDAFWGSGNFHRAIRALRLLGGMDVHLRVAVTAMPQNADDLAANLVDLLLSLGGSRLNVAVNHAWSEGRARSGAFCSTPSAMNEIVAALLRDLHAHGWQGTQPRRPRQPRRSCGYGGSIVVGADGSVYPCAILGEPLGNARTTSLGELGETLWRIYERNTVDHMPVCADCDLRYICGGGCRMRNLREEDDLRQPTCTEESKAAIYRQLLQDVPEDAERLRATYGPNAQIAVSAKRAN